MRNRALSEVGDRWSVKLDVRDFGGHLDTTCRRRAATLIGGDVLLLARTLFVMALPCFDGMVRVLRTKFLPCALRGIEASALSLGLLHKLRSAFCICGLVEEDASGSYWCSAPSSGWACGF